MTAILLAAIVLAASSPQVGATAETVEPSFPDPGAPLTAEAYVDDLAALFENGQLPESSLVAIDSATGCRMEREAAESWLLLEASATEDGIDLVARWCYRDLAAQRRTYNRNCPLVAVAPDPHEAPEAAAVDESDPPATPVTAVRVCLVPTAKPGNSNHGWGRAADLKSGGRLLTCESKAFQWLTENASTYGWVHPEWAACGEPREEAWHWEWGGTEEPPPEPPPRTYTPF